MRGQIVNALINALAGLGEQEGQGDQDRLWAQGTTSDRHSVLTSRARYPTRRRAAILAAMQDPEPSLREHGLRLLLEDADNPELIPLLAAKLVEERSEVRAWVLEVVADYPADERFLPGLQGCLGSRSKDVRRLALHVIGRFSPQPALVGSLGGLLHELFDYGDLTLELVLRYPPDERFVPGLVKYLAHSSPSVRHRTALAIRRAASSEHAVAILVQLDHADASVRNEALKALRYPNDVPAVLERLLALLDSGDVATEHLLGETLACCQDRARLREELLTRDSVNAAYAMAYMRDRDLRPALETLLYADDNRYVLPAILGLELMGATDMIRTFRSMLDPGPPPEEVEYDESAIED